MNQQTAEPIVIPKKKEITFAEICPVWNLLLQGIQQYGIDFSSYEACIVGEAHRLPTIHRRVR
jgi:hypothetical protein